VIALVLLAASCTTDFSKPDPGEDTSIDTEADTSSDTGGDPSVEPSPDIHTDAITDTPGDVEPEVPPPTRVVDCNVSEQLYVPLPAATRFDYGCTEDGECQSLGLWLQRSDELLVVVLGAERLSGIWDAGFWGNTVEPSLDDHTTPTRLTSGLTPSWEPRIWSTSRVRRFGPTVLLVHGAGRYDVPTDTMHQNLRTLHVWLDADRELDWEYGDVFDELTVPPEESNSLAHPRAIAHDGDMALFVQVEQGGVFVPTNQLFGATVPATILTNPSMTISFTEAMLQLLPDTEDTYFPHVPVILEGETIVLPWLHLDFDTEFGAYKGGLWVLPTGFASPDELHSVDFEGSRNFTGFMSACSLGSGFAAAGFSSDNAINAAGTMEPPFALDLFTTDDVSQLSADSIPGEVMLVEHAPLMRNMHGIDLEDSMILRDPERHLFHVVTLAYPPSGAAVHLYSFDDEGRPLMREGKPFVWLAESELIPAFDAMLDPVTGRIYFVNYDAPEGLLGTLEGYWIHSLSCEVIDV
jgi:hypothetical protein